MKTILTAFFVASLVVGPYAIAQPTSAPTSIPTSQPVLKELPDGSRIKTKDGTFQGYSLEEMKVILHIHADYRVWGKQIPLLKKQVGDLTILSMNQSHQINLSAVEAGVLRLERDTLFKKWKEENLKRHLAENKPAFGSWIAWGCVAVATTVAAVLAGILIAKKE